MARPDCVRKPKKDPAPPDPDLLRHIEALGLRSVEAYVEWCGAHGFSRRTDKHWRLRLKEREFAGRTRAQERLARHRREERNPEAVLDAILRRAVREADVAQPGLKAVCRAVEVRLDAPTRDAYLDLLRLAARRADLLDGGPVIAGFGRAAGNTFAEAMLALARQAAHWLRPPADWRPRTHNPRRQFSSLARHLLARWPVPEFLDAAWFKSPGDAALRQQRWFLHLGRGENIRTADLPIPYTRRMAHHFTHAPADMTVEGAIRWGQVLGLGGGERLARVLLTTPLGQTFDHDDFWITVVQFFIAHPMLDPAQVGPIVDYLRHQRFTPQDIWLAPGVVERRPPPQPNLTMKGRTPESLLRQVAAWHGTLGRVRPPEHPDWPPSGLRPLEFIEGSEKGRNLKIWTVREILSTKALTEEGRAMRHCVATYARSCAAGCSSIWTLQAETFDGTSRILTIEVNLHARLIVQARGKCNALPAEKHRGILRRWAEHAGLGLAPYI